MTLEAQADLAASFQAAERGDPDRALTLLRKLDGVARAPTIAYLRGRAWEVLGGLHVAAVFYERAWALDRQNPATQAVLLSALKSTDGARAREMADSVLAQGGRLDLSLVAEAAEVVYEQTLPLPEHEAEPVYRGLIAILTPLFGRATAEHGPNYPPLALVAIRLATCHRWLGETKEAYHFYSLALLLEPLNDALLTGRGILVYGTDSSAVADFEQAIRLGSPEVWPYFFMAHYLLSQGRLDECQRMCELGLTRPAPERIESELHEFAGVSRMKLDYPPAVVQRAFENAVRIDPSNERARQNLRMLLAAPFASGPRQVSWASPSDSTVRASGCQQMSIPGQPGPRKLART